MLEKGKTLCSCANNETRYKRNTHVQARMFKHVWGCLPCLILEKDDKSNILEL